MNFLSLFPCLQLLVWRCFNRACWFRKMRGRKSGSGKREGGEKKRCFCKKTPYLDFSEVIQLRTAKMRCWIVSVRHEECVARGILMMQRGLKREQQTVLLWAWDMRWIITVHRIQHFLVGSHKSQKTKKKKERKRQVGRCRGGLKEIAEVLSHLLEYKCEGSTVALVHRKY